MFGEIKMNLADGGEKTFEFMANGTTPIRYKQVFGDELMEGVSSVLNTIRGTKKITSNNASDLENADSEEVGAAITIMSDPYFDTISKLAYIMNASAEKEDMNKLSFVKYVDWLEQFESLEFVFKVAEILSLYLGNRNGDSTPKKGNAPQNEK